MTAVNKTYGKSIFRTIRSSLSRFLAILAIVALGVGFFAGLLSSPVDMRISADYYYDDTHMYDVKVVSTLGLTENDLSAVQAVEGVEAVMPAYDTDLVLVSEQEDSKHYTARMHSLPEDTSPQAEGYLNQLTLVEGRFPEAAGECVVVLRKSFDGETDWIGQKLMQNPDGEPLEGICEEFTVVGTVKSAAYLSMENESTTAGSGSLGLLAYTVPESFDMDYYTSFYLDGLAPESTLELDAATICQMVASGTVAMYMDNIGAVTSNLEGVIDVGTALYPGKDGIADVGMGGWNLAIPATAENPKGAAIFIDKVTNAEAMELQLKLPALAASLQDEQWTQGINAAYSEMLSSHVRELPPFVNLAGAQNAMMTMLQSVMTGMSTVEQAVSDCSYEIQMILDEQNAE